MPVCLHCAHCIFGSVSFKLMFDGTYEVWDVDVWIAVPCKEPVPDHHAPSRPGKHRAGVHVKISTAPRSPCAHICRDTMNAVATGMPVHGRG